MLWYGTSVKLLFRNVYWNQAKSVRKTLNKTFLPKVKTYSNSSKIFHFYVPHDWKAVLLASKQEVLTRNIWYIYSPTYYFYLTPLNLYLQTYFSIAVQAISLQTRFTPPLFRSYFKQVIDVFRLFAKVWFVKLKIRGKGYYMYKTSRNTITHQFGHSHRTFIYLFSINVKFLSKTNIIFFGLSRQDVLRATRRVRASKPLNIFTSRGVRFSKQIVYKKTGKVSSYR